MTITLHDHGRRDRDHCWDKRRRSMSLTIRNSSVNPGHPFAREGEDHVAVLEFGRHWGGRLKFSHPKNGHPRYPEQTTRFFQERARGSESADGPPTSDVDDRPVSPRFSCRWAVYLVVC